MRTEGLTEEQLEELTEELGRLVAVATESSFSKGGAARRACTEIADELSLLLAKIERRWAPEQQEVQLAESQVLDFVVGQTFEVVAIDRAAAKCTLRSR